MARKQKTVYTVPNEFTFKCDENGFTQEDFYKWSIARSISECNNAEKLYHISRFIDGYLGK